MQKKMRPVAVALTLLSALGRLLPHRTWERELTGPGDLSHAVLDAAARPASMCISKSARCTTMRGSR